MSEFINTIDLIGDEATLDGLLEGTLTEFRDSTLDFIRASAFARHRLLTTVDLPALTNTSGYFCRECSLLENVNIPNVTEIGNYAFLTCAKLLKLDLPKVVTIGTAAFQNSAIETLILRSGTMCTLKNANSLNNTPISKGTGYIYVPRALISSYKTATNWSTYSAQFKELEYYTKDGTVDGELITEPAHQIIGRIILGRYENDSVTSVGSYAFRKCEALTSVSMPSVTTLGAHAFRDCTALTSVNFPSLTGKLTGGYEFAGTGITKIDLAHVTSIPNRMFDGAKSLATVILRSETLCALINVGAFNNTPIASGTGYVYVPQALIDSYKTATNWATYTNQFRAIEDYPGICGGDA